MRFGLKPARAGLFLLAQVGPGPAQITVTGLTAHFHNFITRLRLVAEAEAVVMDSRAVQEEEPHLPPAQTLLVTEYPSRVVMGQVLPVGALENLALRMVQVLAVMVFPHQ
jgi:hypothetical protein